ncbi:hypothetical protein [Flavobacterium sp.]
MDTENKFRTSMERQTWIETILNSTNGMAAVSPDDTLFLKIQQKIKHQRTVAPKTLWLVAASIAALIMLNVSIISSQSKSKTSTKTDYLEMTLNKSNQLYQ